jgi:hypothetical protein
MPVSVRYGDTLLATMSVGETITLNTEGKVLEQNLSVSVPQDETGETGLVVQTNWDNEDPKSPSYIQNKPNLYDFTKVDKIRKEDLNSELVSLLLALSQIALRKKFYFIGSQAQYDTAWANNEIPVGTLVIITEKDFDNSDEDAARAVLGDAILGLMQLGRN